MIVGAVILIFTALIPYQLLLNKRFQIVMLLLSVFSLIYVYFGGHIAGNARSWIKFGPFSLQPAEFVKIVVIIYLAAVYAKKQHYIDHILRGLHLQLWLSPSYADLLFCSQTMEQLLSLA